MTTTHTVQHDYVTQSGRLVREKVTEDGTLTAVMDFVYDESGRPLALLYSANGTDFTTYYYILNLQGDVVKLIGTDGSIAASYTYDAWGNILSSSGTMAEKNPLRYRGYYYDSETGYYYLQSRYYDPTTRRFLNADSFASTGQGFVGTNTFVYCNNNPITFYDPAGHSSQSVNVTLTDSGRGYINADVVVLSIDSKGWLQSSQTMGEYFAYKVGNGSVRVIGVTQENFAETWKNIRASYVIIHTHGWPNGLDLDGGIVTGEDVRKLQANSNIKGMLITACSTGGINGYDDNIAQLFSKRIGGKGLVVCSTTIVSGGSRLFESKDNGAWVIYKRGQMIDKRFPATITIDGIAKAVFA